MKNNFTIADIARILKVSESPIRKDIDNALLNARKDGQWVITFKNATDYINLKIQERKNR